MAEGVEGFHRIEDRHYRVAYDLEGNISEDFTSEQVTQIGFIGDIPVVMMRVDREYAEDGKSYKTLGTRGILKAVDGYLRHWDIQGDIGFATSATYQPSREVDAASVMLEVERQYGHRNIGVITYGTEELAKVKREAHATPPALGQLAGEAHKVAVQIQILRDLLNPNVSQT